MDAKVNNYGLRMEFIPQIAGDCGLNYQQQNLDNVVIDNIADCGLRITDCN